MMSDRILARGWGSEVPEVKEDRCRHAEEEEHESDAELMAYLKPRIAEMIQAIGDNLERVQSSLQRMDRKLGEFLG
jgi:hypothetical protein